MKRYALDKTSAAPTLIEEAGGEYVRHSEADAEIKRLMAELATLKEEQAGTDETIEVLTLAAAKMGREQDTMLEVILAVKKALPEDSPFIKLCDLVLKRATRGGLEGCG